MRRTLPPTLRSQYELILASISHCKIFIEGINSIIAMYAMSVGYWTEFRKSWITYKSHDNFGSPTIATYDVDAPDFRNALLDFSFRGRCMIRFRIHQKGDEMWLGVIGDPSNLQENKWLHRGRGQLWNFYCGRRRYSETGKKRFLANFKPELNCNGVRDGGFGSFHFPQKIFGRFVPCNTGDVVDLEVDAQEKTFKVIVNDVLQACTEAPRMPDQLAFWVQLDHAYDSVEFELLDFSFEKRMERVHERNAVDAKDNEITSILI